MTLATLDELLAQLREVTSELEELENQHRYRKAEQVSEKQFVIITAINLRFPLHFK